MYESKWAQINNMSVVKGLSPLGLGQDATYIVGIIKNIDNTTQKPLSVIASLFDSKNNLIGVQDSSPEFGILNPGETSPFKIQIPNNMSNLDHYLLEISRDVY